tara:strand:- start:159 stop:344 length:186 start_codon:yes stop_codon:yes gene_type:complete
MENCSKIVKIVFGYILGIILLTVLILSLNIHFHKNIREDFSKMYAKALVTPCLAGNTGKRQ